MPVDVAEHERLAREVLPRPVLLVGDRTLDKGSGGEFDHVNASTGRVQATVPLAGASEIDEAIAAARAAFATWRRWRPDERRNALLRLAALVRDNAQETGKLLTLEYAAPSGTALGASARGADYLEYYAGLADKLEGRVVPIFPEDAFDYTTVEPYGVIGLISTWNGGISALCRKAGPALAAGNTVVIKPMELAPFSAVRFGELVQQAGIPAGVVNVLPGGVEAGEALASHPDVDKLTFTGGIQAARAILRAAAENITPAVLELGGKSGNVVFPDADLEVAGRFAGTICMSMAGQGCVFPTRLIVHESVHDEIVERAVATARSLPIGDPLDASTVVGPVVSERHRDRILGMIDRARRDADGEIVLGGNRVEGDLADGFFIEPTIIDKVSSRSYIAQEEVFGPVLSVLTFSDEAEAIALANDTAYGLAGYVFTNDVRRAHRVARELDAGYISINSFAALPASAPFGGFGLSGYGKENGRPGLDEFVREKNVFLQMG